MENNLKTLTSGKCPKCGGATKKILYGMHAIPPEDAILGGCCLNPGFAPTHRCITCDFEMGHGGRNYQTEFDLEVEVTNPDTGVKTAEERLVSLLHLPVAELIKLAAHMIEARHELLHREFPEENLDFLALKDNWKSFPMEPMFDVWFYWNTHTLQIDFAAQFYSHGVRHIHGLFVENWERPGKKRRMVDFERQFALEKNPELKAWNLRNPPKVSDKKLVLDHELMILMRANAQVGQELLYRFCNPVPDGQMWPSWYDPEQELEDVR